VLGHELFPVRILKGNLKAKRSFIASGITHAAEVLQVIFGYRLLLIV